MKKLDPRDMFARGATLDEISDNGDGTFDGARALSALSGIDSREIKWMFLRMKELAAAGIGKDERIRIVKEEGALEPWKR